MPSFPIIDPHVHLWDPNLLDYPWLSEVPAISGPHTITDFQNATGTEEVEKMVFLQADCAQEQSLAELDWVSRTALDAPIIAGIVPFAPLERGEVVRVYLDEIKQYPLVKGVRRLIQHEDLEFCLRPGFVRGVQLLAEYDLSFDLCIFPAHLPSTIELVRQCPNVRFVLDHTGKPDIKNGQLDPWRKQIRTLAELPNVWCKVSGLVTEADHENWTRENLKPYIDHVVNCFGFDRLMFGGDWPVSTLAASYQQWVEALDWALQGSPEEELRKLYRENAVRFYRLEG
ncbi:amidohydrolase family protein [soil metagenome]